MSRRKNGIRKARIQKLNEINKIDKRIKSKGDEDGKLMSKRNTLRKQLATTIIAIIFSLPCFSQTTLTDSEVIKLDSIMTWHEQNDSIQGHTISLLDKQTALYKQQAMLDSTLLFYTNQELSLLNDRVDLYMKLNKEIKPKWYDKKGLWLFIGAGSMIGSAILLDKIN